VLSFPATQCPLKGINVIHVISPARFPDRLRLFTKRSGLEARHFHHFEAVDELSLRRESISALSILFRYNIFGWNTKYMADALSHLTLWRHIASTEREFHLIIQDDALFPRVDWVSRWNDEYLPALPPHV
jgi:hypothetical protein